MSRKEVRRRQPSGSFFYVLPNPPEGTSRGWPVIPHSDAVTQSSRTLMRYPEIPALVSRTFGKHIPHFFIIGFLVCLIAPDVATQSSRTLMRDPENIGKGHPALRRGIQRITGKFTRKILFPGPRIAVRGDTVLDAESRI